MTVLCVGWGKQREPHHNSPGLWRDGGPRMRSTHPTNALFHLCHLNSSEPALAFLRNQRLHCLDPRRVIVQATAAVEMLAAGLLKDLLRFITDLVNCFQAIGGETGRRDKDALNAA